MSGSVKGEIRGSVMGCSFGAPRATSPRSPEPPSTAHASLAAAGLTEEPRGLAEALALHESVRFRDHHGL
nr:hypothetical protein CFP56_33389 [Quercus suber]